MDVIVYLILPIALTVAWTTIWVRMRRVTPWFFIHAITACLVCLVLAALLDQLHPPASGSLASSLGDNAVLIPFFNALTGLFWVLILALATAVIAGARELFGAGANR
jgi:purine-cytosine permease-like protein